MLTGKRLLRFEGCEVDPGARLLKRDGTTIPLNPKTFDLLLYLVEHPQQVISKEELLAAVWPGAFVEESNLTQHIFLLRRALYGTKLNGRTVVTVPGKGYQFAAAVERVEPDSRPAGELVLHSVQSVTRVVVEEESDDETPAQAALPGRRGGRRRVLWAVVAGLIAVAGAGGWLEWKRLNPAPAGHMDLVLADFENTTGDSTLDRPLNQALLIDLEQSPFLNLLSRSRVQETLTEMERGKGEALTSPLAMEVCQRTNAQAMLHGSLAKVGARYLLILDADNCASGKPIAGYKTEVDSQGEVLHALDTGAGRIRRELGESLDSLERYQIPITQATTPSFDALRSFSEAGESFRHGDMKAAQILLFRAVALDPNFASAYRAIGSTYYNLGDYNEAANYYKKAFDLRDRATERERLGIEVMYYGYGLNDYEESIRRTKQLLEIYPNTTNSWVSLSNLYTKLGEYPQAIDAAEHAYRIDPQSSVATVELARSYLRGGRLADAKRIAQAAHAAEKDHWDVHSILFQIAFVERDAAGMKEEGEWGLTHQHANTSLVDLGFASAAGGRLREAMDELSRARSEALRSGDQDFAEGVPLRMARVQAVLGATSQAAESLKQMKGVQGDPSDPGELAYLKAMTGDIGYAERFLANEAGGAGHNTVITRVYAPLLRALLALKSHNPEEAIQDLEAARVYQMRDFTVPFLRAQAEADAGLLDAAAGDCRLILDNPGVDPIAPEYPLAHLGLARILAKQGKADEARKEYEAFLDAWKTSDTDLPQVHEAQRELAQLQ